VAVFRQPFLHRFRGSHVGGLIAPPVPPPVLTVLVPVVGKDLFTTPRLVALVQVEGRLSTVLQPVLTVLVPVGLQSAFTVTVLSIARDGDGNPITDARARRILVPVGRDEVA